jgi:hypothetical protein
MVQSPDSIRSEEARIREAYAKREEADARYSWFSLGHQFMVQQRERRIVTLLRRYGGLWYGAWAARVCQLRRAARKCNGNF